MSVERPDLEALIDALGDAYVLIGDPFTVGGLVPLGIKDGDATVEWNEEYNDLIIGQTGPAIHQRKLRGMSPVVTFPILVGDPELYATLSPTGTAGGGHVEQQPVATTSLVLLPQSEMGPAGLSYPDGAGPWAPAAPEHAIWFWRGHFLRPGASFREAEGGKRLDTVTFQAMWHGASPDGHKLFTIGDPAAQGFAATLAI